MSQFALLSCLALATPSTTLDARDFDPFSSNLERFVAAESRASETALAHDAFADAALAVEPLEALSAPLHAAANAPLAAQVGRPVERVQHTWGPQYWLSAGAYWVDGRYDTPADDEYEEGTALALDFGAYNWRGEMGIALEAGLMKNSYELDGDPLGSGRADVDVWRGMIGLRVADRGPTDSRFVPYARGGFLYRRDDGGPIKDDGIGWYAGLGCDIRLTPQLAVGPSVMFNEANSQNAQEWVFGVLLTLGF